MALRMIVQDGDPVLKKVCRDVVKFDGRLGQLLDDMKETMMDANGLGLAASQVGVLRRVFVALDESSLHGDEEGGQPAEPVILEFINPEIIEQDGEEKAYEGCLSFPGRTGAVVRPTKVKVRALDRSGKPFTLEAEGLMARCICHETDHLNGVTLLDRAEYFYEDEGHPDELDEEYELLDGENWAEEFDE